MDPFPYPLFALICTSICTSTLSLIFATVTISISNLLWIFPAAFVATVAYHAIIFLVSSSEPPGSLHLFSLPNLLLTYFLTCLWTTSFGIAIALIVMMRTGQLSASVPRVWWSMIMTCLCALGAAVAMGFVAASTRKERKRILYAAKWKWRPGHDAIALSQWSIGPHTS